MVIYDAARTRPPGIKGTRPNRAAIPMTETKIIAVLLRAEQTKLPR